MVRSLLCLGRDTDVHQDDVGLMMEETAVADASASPCAILWEQGFRTDEKK